MMNYRHSHLWCSGDFISRILNAEDTARATDNHYQAVSGGKGVWRDERASACRFQSVAASLSMRQVSDAAVCHL
jgi:hypothetical protein